MYKYISDTFHELSTCTKSILKLKINEEEIKSSKVLNNEFDSTAEIVENPKELLNENTNELCNTFNPIDAECNELCVTIEYNESNNVNKSPQNGRLNNNNTGCSLVCTNGNETDLIKLSEQNICSLNLTDSAEIEVSKSEKYKTEVYQFYQNLKMELENYQHFFDDQHIVKHVAHLEIEASKKKEFENIVTDFENKRIDSPNPYLFLAVLKKFISSLEL